MTTAWVSCLGMPNIADKKNTRERRCAISNVKLWHFQVSNSVISHLYDDVNVVLIFHLQSLHMKSFKTMMHATKWRKILTTLTNLLRIDLYHRLTVLQDSCKMHLCSRFCFLDVVLICVYIFSCDIKFNISMCGENTVLNRQYI